MARTIKEIQDEIIKAKDNESALDELTSTSKTSIWRMFIYVVSFAIWTLESLFDKHGSEVDQKINQLKPHTSRWYRNKALDFQYGFSLLADSDIFNNTGKTPQEIQLSKIIKYAAVTESDDQSRLILKIATENSGDLAPVNQTQFDAFKAYIAEVKDAGVKTTLINYLPDRLRMSIRIVRDPLVLDSNGIDRLTGVNPVEHAIKEFIKSLPFDGKLSLQKLEEKLLSINGVTDLSIDLAETSWIDPTKNGYGEWQNIDISNIPVSGYYTVNLTVANDFKSTVDYV